MSEKLEQWKKLTTVQVKMTGAISAATGLEMMEYISRLERLKADLDITEAALGISGLYAEMEKKNDELRKAILTIAALVDWSKDWGLPFSINIDGSVNSFKGDFAT